jgi:hypothetical protein
MCILAMGSGHEGILSSDYVKVSRIYIVKLLIAIKM